MYVFYVFVDFELSKWTWGPLIGVPILDLKGIFATKCCDYFLFCGLNPAFPGRDITGRHTGFNVECGYAGHSFLFYYFFIMCEWFWEWPEFWGTRHYSEYVRFIIMFIIMLFDPAVILICSSRTKGSLFSNSVGMVWYTVISQLWSTVFLSKMDLIEYFLNCQ